MTQKPAMRRTIQWWQQRAEKGRRELEQLFAESAASRRPAARMWPHLNNTTFRQGAIERRPQQQAKPSVASVVYPHLRTENK
jgi:hypothetical protein